MTAIINGKSVSEDIIDKLALEVSSLKKRGISPGLAVVLVGEDPASKIYVKNKKAACSRAGVESFSHELPAETTEAELLSLVHRLNTDKNVHGILVQLPLPKHIDADKVLLSILPQKDVDGFHPENIGKLLLGQKAPRPCTPSGIMELLAHTNVDCSGKHAVVVGRSNIVGKPVAFMLLEKNATVTICHSRTKNLAEEISRADILVAAIGKPNFIKGEWIKEGAVVIDVGINRLDTGKLVGDVHFESASKRAGAITPVPGGVGPMTIAMLIKNTVEAAKGI